MACQGVPGRIRGATACSGMLRAAGWAGCGRLLAAAAMRRDYMGALALGRQQKVARNGPIGGYLDREVEVRERLRHVDVCCGARSTSPSTRRLERRAEALKSCRPNIFLLHHQLRGASQRSFAGELSIIFTWGGARASAVSRGDALECIKQGCAHQHARAGAQGSTQAHAPARSLPLLAVGQVIPPKPMGIDSPCLAAFGSCSTYT